ncbi:hypothetical protein Tco_1129005, partial [Tanacetum coccineum]
MGKFRETLVEGAEGAVHLGRERDRVFADLTLEKKERYKADIRTTNILLQGFELPKDERESQLYDDFEHFRQNRGETIHEYYVRFVTVVKLNRGLKTSNYDQLYAYLKQHEAHANENNMMLEKYNEHAIDPIAFMSNVSPQQYPTQSSATLQSAYIFHQVDIIENSEYFKEKMLLIQAQENGVVLDKEQLLFIAGGQDNSFDDDVDEPPVQDLALTVDNIFQADQCNAFDSNVDEAPTTQTMFMVNLSSADPIYDEAGPSYDSDILSEVPDHDNYLDSVDEYHKVHKMQDNVQPNCVVESDAKYTSDSNIIPYEQYAQNNAEQVVQSNVSSVPNDAYMMIINDMHEQTAQCVSANE